MKNFKIYLVIVFTSALTSCGGGKNNKLALPPIRETYSRQDKNPFGGSVAYDIIKNAYDDHYISQAKDPFNKLWLDNSFFKSLYISISKTLYTSEEDITNMLQFAKNGNDLFLVSREFDSTLLKQAGVEEVNAGDSYFLHQFYPDYTLMDDSKVNLSPEYYRDTSLHPYFYYPFSRHFKMLPGSKAKVLGNNHFGKPNCIVFFYGSGKIFLHCEPRAFSNYYLLKKENVKELTSLLGYAMNRPSSIYYDVFYSKQNGVQGKSNSGLAYLLSKPPLAWAFWLSLLLLLLYILFGGKRSQRIVPVLKPNINYTVNFAETVGLLYFQNKSNRNIADKMILYFNDFVRNNYYLNTTHITDEFITTLSRKSGVPEEQVNRLYATIKATQNNFDVDDYRLLALNNQIQNFYKKLK